MVSRNGNAMDNQYPELSVLPHHIKLTDAILDAEIAALDDRGAPSFERLQSRINVVEASAIALLRRHTPVVLYVFDLLYADGHDLRGVPPMDRKVLLEEVLTIRHDPLLRDILKADGAELWLAAAHQGIEGIIGKRRKSFYESRRGSDWVKYKVTDSDSLHHLRLHQRRARPLRGPHPGQVRRQETQMGLATLARVSTTS